MIRKGESTTVDDVLWRQIARILYNIISQFIEKNPLEILNFKNIFCFEKRWNM